MRFDTGENEVVKVMSVQSRPVQIASDQDAERQASERQTRLIQNRPVDIISGWDTERQAMPAPVISEQARERQPRK
jgi:hypothetical protein